MRSDLHAALFPCHRCGLPVYVRHEPFGDSWVTADGKPHINCERRTPAPAKRNTRLVQPDLFADDPDTAPTFFYDDRGGTRR